MARGRMADDVIGMDDMEGVFSVTDSFGISRELISVALEKSDPGSVLAGKSGVLEIVLPRTRELEAFLNDLWRQLEDLGYQAE